MTLRLDSIANPGHSTRERVVLKALVDCDLGEYAILQARLTFSGGAGSGDVSRAYWFPARPLKRFDWVVLYTKAGKESEKVDDRGRTSIFLYWGLQNTIWAGRFVPVLLHSPKWQTWNEHAPAEDDDEIPF